MAENDGSIVVWSAYSTCQFLLQSDCLLSCIKNVSYIHIHSLKGMRHIYYGRAKCAIKELHVRLCSASGIGLYGCDHDHALYFTKQTHTSHPC